MSLSGCRFTETHEWVCEKNGLLYVGISDHAQEEITDVVFVDLPEVGKEVLADDELLMIDSVKASFSIYAPVSGRIAKVNEELADRPELVNESCYEEGWLVALEAADPSETESLMTPKEYDQFVSSLE